jgi:hypothetical protein
LLKHIVMNQPVDTILQLQVLFILLLTLLDLLEVLGQRQTRVHLCLDVRVELVLGRLFPYWHGAYSRALPNRLFVFAIILPQVFLTIA